MLKKLSVLFTTLAIFGSPVMASAGMSHGPHNAKTYMGFERKAKKTHGESQSQKGPKKEEKVKSYQQMKFHLAPQWKNDGVDHP